MYTVCVIDDQRSFVDRTFDDNPFLDGGEIYYCRTSTDAEDLLFVFNGMHLDELWLDFDLGDDDTTDGIALRLEEYAVTGRPYDIARIYIHSMNPIGRTRLFNALSRHYPVTMVANPVDVGLIVSEET